MKKIICTLCAVLTLSLTTLPVFADKFADEKQNAAEETTEASELVLTEEQQQLFVDMIKAEMIVELVPPVIYEEINKSGAYILYNISISKTDEGKYRTKAVITENLRFEISSVYFFPDYENHNEVLSNIVLSLKEHGVESNSFIQGNYGTITTEFETETIPEISEYMGIPELVYFYDKDGYNVIDVNSDVEHFGPEEDIKNDFFNYAIVQLTLNSADKIIANCEPQQALESPERNSYVWIITPEINNKFAFQFETVTQFEKYFYIYLIIAAAAYSILFFIINKIYKNKIIKF